jgi:hypothetical protein
MPVDDRAIAKSVLHIPPKADPPTTVSSSEVMKSFDANMRSFAVVPANGHAGRMSE